MVVSTPSRPRRKHSPSMASIPTSFHCRRVLLDIARLRGVDTLGGGEAVTADDLSLACDRQGIAVEPSDAVLIRTGWSKRWAIQRPLSG